MKFLKTKFITLICLTLTLIFLFLPRTTFAIEWNPINWFTADAVTSSLMSTFYGILSIFQRLLALCAAIVGEALKMNSNISKFSYVRYGWTIMRDLANLGFVLIIIVIAFATMLRIQSYGMKNTLWKLVAAALLVNFSLVISGYFIDASNLLSKTFLDRFGDNKEQMGTIMVSSMKIERLSETKGPDDPSQATKEEKDAYAGASKFGAALLRAVSSLFFVLLFTLAAVFTLAAFAIMLLIRMIIVSFLLIIMPIVWVLWILPITSKYWEMWWSTFMRWVIFVPIMSFCLYLALSFSLGVPYSVLQEKKETDISVDVLLPNVKGFSINFLMSIGLLLGGLIASNKLGIYGAGVSMALAQKAKGFAIGSIKKTGQWAKTRALTAGAKPEEKKPSFVQGFADKLSRIPGFRGVGGAISGAVAGAQRDVDARGKKFNDWSDPQIKNYALSKIRKAKGDPVEDAALLQRIAKSKDLLEDKDIEAELPKLFRAALKTKSEKAILEVRPDMAKLLGKGIAEEMAKKVAETMAKISASKTSNISAESFKDGLVVLNLNLPQLSNLARDGSDEQKNNIIETLLKTDTDRSALKPEDVKKLDNLLKNIPKIPNWQDVADRLPKPQKSIT